MKGLLVQFGITGLARAGVGAEQAQSPHYVYTAAFFLLLAIGSWLAPLRIGWDRPRPLAVLSVLTAVALAANLLALYVARDAFLERAEHTRAAILVLTGLSGLPPAATETGLFPISSGMRLLELFDRYGSPLGDALSPVAPPSSEMLERVRSEYFP